MDVFKGFNTAFYEKGMLIDDRRSIVKSYLKNGFPFDFLTGISVMANRVFFPKMDYHLAYFINMFLFCKLRVVIQVIRKVDTTFAMRATN